MKNLAETGDYALRITLLMSVPLPGFIDQDSKCQIEAVPCCCEFPKELKRAFSHQKASSESSEYPVAFDDQETTVICPRNRDRCVEY